jgi:hypothetical protein
MSLDEQLNALDAEALAAGRTAQQRQAAKAAFDKLIAEGIEESIGKLQEGTAVYVEVSEQLQEILDEIRGNAMPDVLGKANEFIAAVNNAVGNNDGD